MPVESIDPQLIKVYASRISSLVENVVYVLLDYNLRIIQYLPEHTNNLVTDLDLNINHKITDYIYELSALEDLVSSLLNHSRQVISLENLNRTRPDGSLAFLTVHLSLANPHNPEDGLLLLLKDATETGTLQQTLLQERNELRLLKRELTKKNEKLKLLDRLKSLFFSMATHDLRSPLTAIRGFAGLLLELNPTLEARSKDFVNIIVYQTERLNRLLDDFLELDLIEQNRIQLYYKTFDLSRLIHEVADLFKVDAQKKRQKFFVEAPQTISMSADFGKVERILYNLLSNAIKYTPEEGTIQIRAFETVNDVVFEIVDNGYGMSADEAERLFTLYYRTDHAAASDISGSGIGLYIVKTFVDAHEGEITVSSQFGQGTAFRIRLPKAQSAYGEGRK